MNFATKKILPSILLFQRNPLTNELPKSVMHFMKILDEYNFLIEIKEDFYSQYQTFILFPQPRKTIGTEKKFQTASKQFYLKNNNFVKEYFKNKVVKGIQYV